MNIELAPLSEIETALNNFDFIETNNSSKPIMGRSIIGTILEKENLKNNSAGNRIRTIR